MESYHHTSSGTYIRRQTNIHHAQACAVDEVARQSCPIFLIATKSPMFGNAHTNDYLQYPSPLRKDVAEMPLSYIILKDRLRLQYLVTRRLPGFPSRSFCIPVYPFLNLFRFLCSETVTFANPSFSSASWSFSVCIMKTITSTPALLQIRI